MSEESFKLDFENFTPKDLEDESQYSPLSYETVLLFIALINVAHIIY